MLSKHNLFYNILKLYITLSETIDIVTFLVSHRRLVRIMSTTIYCNRDHSDLRVRKEKKDGNISRSHIIGHIDGYVVYNDLLPPGLRDCQINVFVSNAV